MKQVHRTLDKYRHVGVYEVHVNIWDLFSCLEKFREIFETEKENHIHVNVSTGSKVIAIAGMLACMLWKGSPYYAKLNYEEGGAGVSADKRKVSETQFLPVYQINMPSPESLQVLSIIDNAGGSMSKKDLIVELQSLRVIPVYLPSQPRSAPHSRLRAILDPLQIHWQFIEVKSRGRRSIVTLTGQGRSALRIFGTGT